MVKSESRRTADELNSAAIHLLRALRSVDRRSGLTAARLSALSVLVFGGSRTPGRLAADEDVTAPTMTGIVHGLVELGLADREPHPDNARMVVVSATPDGERVMRRARERRVAAIAAALDSLPAASRRRIVAAGPDLVELARVLARGSG